MKTMKRLLAATAACMALSASAAPLTRGGAVEFTPATGASPAHRGTVLDQTSGQFRYFDFCCTGLDQWWVLGTVESQVVRADDGTLDFYMRVQYDIESLGLLADRFIERMTLTDFFDPRFTYLPGVLSGSGAYLPSGAFVHGDTWQPEEPDAVHMWFLDGAPSALEWSDWIFFDTDATRYRRDAGVYVRSIVPARTGSERMLTFGPAPIPEPATWASLGLGLCLLGAVTQRRRRVPPSTAAAPA